MADQHPVDQVNFHLLDALHGDAAILAVDAHGQVTQTNRVFEQLSPDARIYLTQQTAGAVTGRDEPSQASNRMFRTITSGRTWRGRLEQRDSEGNTHEYHSIIAPVFTHTGALQTVVAVYQQKLQPCCCKRANERDEQSAREIIEGLDRLCFFYRHDHRGIMQYISSSVTAMLGYSPTEYLSRHYSEFSTDHPVNQLIEGYTQAALNGERQPHYKMELYHKNGERRMLEVAEVPQFNAQGEVESIIGVARDITQQEQQNLITRQLSQAVEQSPASVVITDRDGRIEYVNSAFTETTGYAPDEALGQNPRILKSGKHDPAYYREMWQTLTSGGTWRGEMQNKRKDGQLYWELVVISPLMDEQGHISHYVAVKQEITERKRIEQQLRVAATTDRLTGLANRASLMDHLQTVVRRANERPDYRFAVLFLDFDRFKVVNDSLGHDMGDELLRQISMRLRETLRPGDGVFRTHADSIPARLGGDEFVIILENINSTDDARATAERLLDAMAIPYRLGNTELCSTASVGVVTSDLSHASADEVLRDADTAMYEAKLTGQGCVVMFEQAMRDRVRERLYLENELRRVLDDNQLFVVYQPIISLDDGSTPSVEALLRWRHPQRGLISPGEFIPIAEETGMIIPIGEWVLRQACAQLVRWQTEAPHLAPARVSVNLSRVQLESGDLVTRLRAILAETGINPACLQLEVTEREVMRNREQAKQLLCEIHDLGIQLAMDDFGTGYSSLACLHEFPFDTLKIDRSFILNLDRSRIFAAMVQAVTALGENLGMRVVAEGVETEEQIALLQSLGCDFAQGFYFSKPIGPEKVLGFIKAHVPFCANVA